MRSRLKKMIPAFGLALVASLALGAVVANGAFALSFVPETGSSDAYVVSGSEPKFTAANGEYVGCTSGGGAGAFNSGGTSGAVTLIFKNCKLQPSEISCGNTGVPGEIKLNQLSNQLVYLDAAKTKFGLSFAPTTGNTIAEISCLSGLLKKVWTGNFLAEITSPALNTTASAFTVNAATGTLSYQQQYRQVEGAGPVYQMFQTNNGGAAEQMSLRFKTNDSLTTKGKFIP